MNLLVSGLVSSQGLYAVTDRQIAQVDAIHSTGLLQTPNSLLRARFGGDRPSGLARSTSFIDLFVDGKITDTWEVPDSGQLHSLIQDGDQVVAVDTTGNRLLWLNQETGVIERDKQFSTVPDSWHLNSLAWDDDRLVVSCLGRTATKMGWWGKGPDKIGEVLDVETGLTVLNGLAAPHNPTRFNDGWLICESFLGELVYYPDEWVGDEPTRLVLGGWPRGLLLDGNTAWVGVSDSYRVPSSPPPHSKSPGKLVAVDLNTWEITQQILMPCSGIYDIVAGDIS